MTAVIEYFSSVIFGKFRKTDEKDCGCEMRKRALLLIS